MTLASDNVFDAAAILLESAASSFKKMLAIKLFGEVSVSATDQQRELTALAREYREMARADAAMQLSQLQMRVDLYGRDKTDYDKTTAVTVGDFEDYSEDEFANL